ncbi:MAG: PQQ-binding-like beta-propeller repeat protein [Bythopirellula sp.]
MRLSPCAVALLWILSADLRAQDWPQWRGLTGDNHAASSATAPVNWDESTNLVWNVPVPGRGHSSPTVIGDRIYLTTADAEQQTQSLLIYQRHTGELLTEKIAHQGGLTAKLHPNNSHASSTVASDGERVFALFNQNGAVWVTAFDLDGQQLWQERAIGFEPKIYEFGFGSSPVVVDDKVIVASEYDGAESGIVALDTTTGKQRWKIDRPQSLSYSTPARFRQGDQVLLVTSGNLLFAAYDPADGSVAWSTEGTTMATCGTMVWNEQRGLAFASGGYPLKFTAAVRTDGDHGIVWSNYKIKCYEQSMLVVGDYLYAVTDPGLVHCLRCSDGEEQWKQRLGGRGVSSSPVLIDGKIYVTSERGTTYVFTATPDGFELLGENQLGSECFATPTPIGNRLYHRYAVGTGAERQEYLAAIGE